MTIHPPDTPDQHPQVDQCWKHIGVLGDRSCPKLAAAVHCRNCPVFADMGQQLFERQPSTAYVGEQTAQLAQEIDTEEVGTQAMIIFRVGEEWLAINVDTVVEVAPPRTIHRVPHRSDRLLLGIANIRGELPLCVSLRELLAIADTPDQTSLADTPPHAAETPTASPATRLLVCQHVGRRWAFVVDQVDGVHRISTQQLGNVPSTVAKDARHLADVVFPWRGKTVGRLDSDRLFDSLQERIG